MCTLIRSATINGWGFHFVCWFVRLNPTGRFEPNGPCSLPAKLCIFEAEHSLLHLKAFAEQLTAILTISGIVQGFYLALLLHNGRARKGRANLFLSILLIALSFSIAHMLYAERIINHLAANVYSLGDPTFLLIAPLLWFYAIELTGKRQRTPYKILLHFAPFLLIILCSLTFKSIDSANFNQFINANHWLLRVLFWVLVVAQFSLYQFFLHKKLLSHHAVIQQEVSNTENLNLEWVRFFMIVFLAINLFFLFNLFAVIHLHDRSWLPKATALLFSISIFALGYKGLFQREISVGAETESNTARPSAKPDQELIAKIVAFMTEKKPYLDPELTLTSLARDVGISRTQLSQLINEGIGDNFYDFVNKFRVEEVKMLLADPGMNNYSLLGIALEAGFKSKSTFNFIFKRFTGLTPSAYKKNLEA